MVLVDLFNIYGLLMIGLALFLGFLIRYAAIGGVVLLALYYFAYPPFGAIIPGLGPGNLFIVNKNFIEAAALIVLLFIKEKGYGLYAFDLNVFRKGPTGEGLADGPSRRNALKNLATLPALGMMGWGAYHARQLYGVDTLSGATIKVGAADISELKGTLPKGQIGPHAISRLVLGGNLIGGWAHSRDLIYVPSLFRAYNTEQKIFDTLILAEKAGIDTINIGFVSNPLLEKYKKVTGGKIKVISQVHPDMENNDYFVNINKAIDHGVDIVQVQGNWCDWLVRDNRMDVIDEDAG